MALISPTLDNRSFEQLKQELIGRIAVYAPEWTDHNESDPGIALLELFAYLGESLLYRFNQIPETTRIEFLRLLGVQPRPAQSAHVLVSASTDEPKGVQILKDSVAKSGAVSFQTDDEVYVWPLDILAAGKTPPPDSAKEGLTTSAGDEARAKAEKERRDNALARAKIPKNQASFYTTTVVSVDPLAPDAVLVDVSAQVDNAIWIALLRKPTTDLGELAGKIIFVGVSFDEVIEDLPLLVRIKEAKQAQASGKSEPAMPGDVYTADELTSDPPPMIWQLWQDPKVGDAAFVELKIVGDTTRGMVTSGVVKVVLPDTVPTLSGQWDGGKDSPPPLAEKLAKNVVAWIRVSRPDTPEIGDAIKTVRWVGVNVVSAVQSTTAAAELVGTGTGDGDQRYPLNQRPVISGTAQLQVEEQTGWTTWDEVENFVGSSMDDRHYMIDRDAGAIVFGGTGVRVPQLGERIRVLSYRYGGGDAGNVRAGTVTSLSSGGNVKITNPLPAVGGKDKVALADALDAIPAEVHRHDRAVILDDFEDLAEQVAGVRRADALRLFHPDTPGVPAAGVISVVVFPDNDVRNPNAPMPELGLLRRVARFLDARRLLTTELYVIPPEYVKISLSVGVQVRDGYQVDAIRRWVEQILRQYLAPLPPSGPDGGGWPLGRTIHRAELEAVAVQVEGVEYIVDELILALDVNRVAVNEIKLESWQVPEIVKATIVAGKPLGIDKDYGPAPPKKIPVPLPPDVC